MCEFERQGRFPCLPVSLPACNGLLRLTSYATPADVLTASMATELYLHTNIGGAQV